MASHHFVGKGWFTERLVEAVRQPEALIERLAERVRGAGLQVVGYKLAEFEGGGVTAVLVLAESHLVLHYWPEERYATIDLHVCDYRRSNRRRAASLVASLEEFCFLPEGRVWRELHLEDPVAEPQRHAPSAG